MFDLKDDPGETKDLSKTYPDIFQDLLNSYDDYVEVNGVVELQFNHTIYFYIIIIGV